MKLLILAGGYGTRLYPVVKDTPKALLEVAGKTLIDHTLEKFFSIPLIDEVVVVTNAKFYSLLSDWAKARHGKPFEITVISDGTYTPEERLGAIGDIVFVLDRVRDLSDWIIVGSDNLFDFSLTDFVRKAAAQTPDVTIGCYDIGKTSAATQYGVVEIDPTGRILSLEEKPKVPRSSLISMCLYYLPQTSLPLLRAFLTETGKKDTTGGYIQWLHKKTSVYGFKFSGKWYDIGSLEAYEEAQNQFLIK